MPEDKRLFSLNVLPRGNKYEKLEDTKGQNDSQKKKKKRLNVMK